jgi:hypothetical protein
MKMNNNNLKVMQKNVQKNGQITVKIYIPLSNI